MAKVERSLSLNDVLRLETLGSLRDIKLYGLTLFQGLVPFTLDGREMDEDVAAVLLLDETVPFGVVEPLHFSFRHYRNYLLSTRVQGLALVRGGYRAAVTEARFEGKKKPPKPKSAFVVLYSLKPQNRYSSHTRRKGYIPIRCLSTDILGWVVQGSKRSDFRQRISSKDCCSASDSIRTRDGFP